MKPSLKLFILGSILLNLLMAGLILGHVGKRIFGKHPQFSAHDITRLLPEEKREQWREITDALEERSEAQREKLKAARQEASSHLCAENFNREAYVTAIQQIDGIRGEMMQDMASTLATIAEHLNQEERRKLSELFQKPHRGKHAEKPTACTKEKEPSNPPE